MEGAKPCGRGGRLSPPQSALGPPWMSGLYVQLRARSTLLLLVSLVSPGAGSCPSVRLQLTFLSLLSLLPLTRRPLHAPLAHPTHTHPPSSPLDCSSLPPSLLSPPPPRLVHGGKGTRFTLSEDIYPEKGTCLRHPPAPGARCLRPSQPRLVKGPSFRLHGPGPRLGLTGYGDRGGQGGRTACWFHVGKEKRFESASVSP